MQDQELIPGLVFKPTNVVLVNYFLRRRIIDGLSAPDYLIKEFDVYSTEPWNLPNSFRYQNKDRDMLFFTPRRPTSCNAKRASCTAGKGFWNGNGKDESIKIGSEVIGHRTSLNYKIVNGKEKIKTEWIMHEFRFSKSPSNAAFDDLVLCRIHEKKKNKNDDGNKRSREQEEEAEQSLSKRRRVEEEEPGSVPLSSSSASSHMIPAFESVEGCEALLASDDGLFLEEAQSAADEGLWLEDNDWDNLQLWLEEFFGDLGSNNEM